MKFFSVKEALKGERLETLGRTYLTENGDLYCNWTCAGVRFVFEGTALAVEMKALPGMEPELDAMTGQSGQRKLLPWIAVFVDGEEEPFLTFEVKEKEQLYPIFTCEESKRHQITIRKLTENSKAKLCIRGFLSDGQMEKPPVKETRLLEFIGDSITCGFGNMSNEPDHAFYTQEENGWMSHAAVAARLLGAGYSIVACSGIALTEGLGFVPYSLLPMSEYYPYRDRFLEEELKISPYQQWDFSTVPDAIVINLGTNDATVIDLNGRIEEGREKFENDYYRFLQMLRSYNGKKPWIICALGSLDYFLFDSIKRSAARFRDNEQDERIRVFRYNRVRVNDPLGACRHPNVVTQLRMGQELAAFLRGLPGWDR